MQFLKSIFNFLTEISLADYIGRVKKATCQNVSRDEIQFTKIHFHHLITHDRLHSITPYVQVLVPVFTLPLISETFTSMKTSGLINNVPHQNRNTIFKKLCRVLVTPNRTLELKWHRKNKTEPEKNTEMAIKVIGASISGDALSEHRPKWEIFSHLPWQCHASQINGKVKSSTSNLEGNLSTSQQLSCVILAWKERTLWNRPD